MGDMRFGVRQPPPIHSLPHYPIDANISIVFKLPYELHAFPYSTNLYITHPVPGPVPLVLSLELAVFVAGNARLS